WLTLPKEQYDEERALFGDLEDFDTRTSHVAISPAKGSAEDLRAFFDRVRDEDPDEPFWRGVEAIDVEGNAVVLRFHDGVDPALLADGAVRVACHLHDPAYLSLRPAVAR